MNRQSEGFVIVVSYAEEFNKLLLSIQHGMVTQCTWIVTRRELRIRWEDTSKIMQAEMIFPAEMFYSFNIVGERIEFNVPMKLLFKALGLMSVVRDVQSEIQYECSQRALCFRSLKHDSENVMREYVKLKTVEGSTPADYADTWCAPEASFISQGGLFKSIIDDFPPLFQSPIVIQMNKEPTKVMFRAARMGLEMEFEVPGDLINLFQSELQVVEHGYSQKVLKTVFCNVPTAGVQTKVSIDGSGMLRVMHLCNLPDGESLWGSAAHTPAIPATPTSTAPAHQGTNSTVTIMFWCKAQLLCEDLEPMADNDDVEE